LGFGTARKTISEVWNDKKAKFLKHVMLSIYESAPEDFLDAKRVLGVLGKRPARYGLTLHPDKTRFVERPR
jgi:hypothetical protein